MVPQDDDVVNILEDLDLIDIDEQVSLQQAHTPTHM